MTTEQPSSSAAVDAAGAALRGPLAHDVVRDLLDRRGIDLVSLRTSQVLARPGRREVVRWRADTEFHGEIDVVGVAGKVGAPGPVEHVVIGGHAVAVFVLPDDPALPGLPIALDPDALARQIRRSVVSVRRRRYRPLSRAVVEAELANGHRLWVKALRPGDSRDLAAVHERCQEHVRVPRVQHLDTDLGLLVLDDLRGRDLRTLLRREGASLPDPDEVLDLSRGLARVVSPDVVGRTPPLASVRRSARRLVAVLPAEADRVERLADRIAATPPSPAPPLPGPTIHGDFHAAQVQVRRGRVVGLVDLDDVGAGDPHDDVARFLAHLLCTVDRSLAAWARPWAEDCHRAVLEIVPEERLVPRVAAGLLSLALGPHRVHEKNWEDRTRRRIDVVEHWLDERPGLLPPHPEKK